MLQCSGSRLTELMQSEIRAMSVECAAVQGINLAQGICDIPIPDVLRIGVNEAIENGYNHYTRCDGIDYLKTQLLRKARAFNRIDTNEANIVVSAGATGALYCAMYSLLQPGDEVVLFEPFYGYHEYTLRSLDLVPAFVRLTPPDWAIDFDKLESMISKKTKAILFCTPMNPCGKVFSEIELIQLGDICARHNILVFSDEIYEYITYGGKEHLSPASIELLRDRTITISGYSKTFSITGWRIGYSISTKEQAEYIAAANDLMYVCAPSPMQYAVAKAIEGLPPFFYSELSEKYERKRDMLCSTLLRIGFTPYVPEGAYYVLADISKVPGQNCKEKAMFLLRKGKIAVVPGSAFYHNDGGGNIARFCFAKNEDIIELACVKLQDFQKYCN